MILKIFPLSIISLISWLSLLSLSLPVLSNPSNSRNSLDSTCPQDIENLTSLLIPQIPSYANRVIQRARKLDRNYDLYSYVIIAGKPEFEPLKLTNQEYNPIFSDTTKQIFFTTLERKYINNKPVQTQNYHWIFLTSTNNGWRLVMAFSRFGSTFPDGLPTPIEETTHSVIGETIRLWLRDCQSNSLRKVEGEMSIPIS